MTPTRRTGQNQEAEAAKKVADPPNASSARPKGVSTVSSATLPTTRRDMFAICGGRKWSGRLGFAVHAVGSVDAENGKTVRENDLDGANQHETRAAQRLRHAHDAQLRVQISGMVPGI